MNYQKDGISAVLVSLKMLHTSTELPCSELPACGRTNLYKLSHRYFELCFLQVKTFLR